MSGPGGRRAKTAEELLGDMLTEAQHVAVLKYAVEHDLASDDVVYFLLGLLKVFAHVHNEIITAIEFAEVGRDEMVTAVNMGGQELEEKVTDQVASLKHAFTDMNNIMGYHAAQFAGTAGEIKGLREDLDKLNREAAGTLSAYKRIVDDGTGASLSQLFQRHMSASFDLRMRAFDDTIRPEIIERIADESRRHMVWGAIQFVVLVILVIIFRR